MTETTANDPPERVEAERTDGEHDDPARTDPLDRIASELDDLAELDPAEAVAVLADVTAELNKQLDADTDRSWPVRGWTTSWCDEAWRPAEAQLLHS